MDRVNHDGQIVDDLSWAASPENPLYPYLLARNLKESVKFYIGAQSLNSDLPDVFKRILINY
jgi:hypothetical protein